MADSRDVSSPGRRLVELDRVEAMALVAGVEYGRVVFTHNALPAIRPINHIVDGADIIIRTRLSAKVATEVRPGQAASARPRPQGVVVAYQVDQIDPVLRLGWSVVATGYAQPVTVQEDIVRFEKLLVPWLDMPMDVIIRIHPEIVTGFRLIDLA